jgi:hypothetical protein
VKSCWWIWLDLLNAGTKKGRPTGSPFFILENIVARTAVIAGKPCYYRISVIPKSVGAKLARDGAITYFAEIAPSTSV